MDINPILHTSATPQKAQAQRAGEETVTGRGEQASALQTNADNAAISGRGHVTAKKPIKFSPTIVEGKMVKVAQHGNNSPVIGYARLNGKKRPVVFKQEINRNAEDPKVLLNSHIKAVVASRIMDKFGVPTALYYPARMEMEDGTKKEGIISEYVQCKNLYEDPSLLEKITNPDEAVAGSIVGAWLGDSDRILNEGNVWVRPDGKVIFGDFGYAFRRRVTCLGLPKTNLKIMHRYATKENVEPIVDKIASLADEDIDRLVEESGSSVKGWNKEVAAQIKGILIHNRNELRKRNPFEQFYDKTKAGPSIEIEHKVMVLLRDRVKDLAANSTLPQGSSPEEDEPYFLMLQSRGRVTGMAMVDSQGLPSEMRDEQRRMRREIQGLAKGIPDWNKNIENQLMQWIVYHDPLAEEFFRDSPANFYPLLKFMRSLFQGEEILGHSLGIV